MALCVLCASWTRVQRQLHYSQQIRVLSVRGKRTKAKSKLSYGKNKNEPTELALKHFDQNYRPLFGSRWPSIRLGLLSMQSSGALVNNYSDVQPTMDRLHSLGNKDFVQAGAERVAQLCRERGREVNGNVNALSNTESDTKDVVAGNQEGLAMGHSPSDHAQYVDDITIAQELQRREISKQAQEEEEDLDGLDSPEENEVREVKVGGADKTGTAWWEGKYIVAPGYEHRMDQLQQLELEEACTSGHSDIRIIDSGDIHISPDVRCFVPEDGPKRLPPAKKGADHPQLQYYIMDAASVLPVLAMDIRPDDVVLDLCAGPGGKSLAILQTMLVGSLTANEMVGSRRRRLQEVLSLFLPRNLRTSGAVRVSGLDGCQWGQVEPNSYDKVLVDVPCSTDRVSATVSDNNLFKVSRSRERWDLPQLQTDLLSAGILAAKPGGAIVYSTCTMSPLQNDGVVQSAIAKCREEFNVGVDVVDLSPLAEGFSSVFNFFSSCRYGQLVVPLITANYGPMYFARLQRHT